MKEQKQQQKKKKNSRQSKQKQIWVQVLKNRLREDSNNIAVHFLPNSSSKGGPGPITENGPAAGWKLELPLENQLAPGFLV